MLWLWWMWLQWKRECRCHLEIVFISFRYTFSGGIGESYCIYFYFCLIFALAGGWPGLPVFEVKWFSPKLYPQSYYFSFLRNWNCFYCLSIKVPKLSCFNPVVQLKIFPWKHKMPGFRAFIVLHSVPRCSKQMIVAYLGKGIWNHKCKIIIVLKQNQS